MQKTTIQKTITLKEIPKQIKFYDHKDPYYEFSNFYGILQDPSFQLTIDEQSWTSTEHYYQAMKFMGPNATDQSIQYAQLIRTTDTPGKVFMLGRQKIRKDFASIWKHSKQNTQTINNLVQTSLDQKISVRSDWDLVKDHIMKQANEAKYTQNEKLRLILLSTQNALLIEHTKRDNYWGDGGDGTGLNRLGQILMEIRDNLRQNI